MKMFIAILIHLIIIVGVIYGNDYNNGNILNITIVISYIVGVAVIIGVLRKAPPSYSTQTFITLFLKGLTVSMFAYYGNFLLATIFLVCIVLIIALQETEKEDV